ncbi:MAG: YceI family protein [Flammeovirgaceae bacterium]|nr:YceI family protein [Flammeovirgaceae bacterium]
MKILPAIFIVIVGNVVAAQSVQLPVSTTDSKIIWTGTKVVGYHQGTIKLKEGFVKLQNQKLIGGYFIIDMRSIVSTDIPDTDSIPKMKLESHLKSEDFFDVRQYSVAKFEIKEIRSYPDQPAKYFVLGDLTIKGITNQLKIEIEPSTQSDKLFIAQADIRFDRQMWGVAYKGLKDELVHDEVKLNVIIKAR